MPPSSLSRHVRRLRQETYPAVKKLAFDLGLLQGHTDYTRFVILGRSRSGSNFLRGLLNAHSQITAFGELFQNEEGISWGLSGYESTPRLEEQFRNEPVRFLESKIFCRVPKQIRAVGFKIFYYHAHSEKWQPVWDYLAGQPRLKVIHIRRQNILETHLSRKRAVLTDSWVNTSGEREKNPAVRLNYEECLADFEQTRGWEQEYERFFAGHDLLTLCYEELARDYAAEIGRVQRFLGVDAEPVAPQTFKQSAEPLSAAIVNYAELKERFAGTPWAAFFAE